MKEKAPSRPRTSSSKPRRGSWHGSGKSYDKTVGQKGHHYHQQVVLPGVLRLLDLPPSGSASLLDAACGQGVLERSVPSQVFYAGVDIAPSLVAAAKARCTQQERRKFSVADVTRPLSFPDQTFTHAACILALQNIEAGDLALKNIAQVLRPDGKLVVVLNHPCYRIPRQSHWGVDAGQDIQYRRIDRYMSPIDIPIRTHPGRGEKSDTTWSFHHPLSTYIQWINNAGLRLESMEEWCSDKESTGKAAKRENRSRNEIPLFMALVLRKPTNS